MEHQNHYGKKFYKDHKSGYWISTSCPKIRAHRWVWECVHGKIPKGLQIHHKDHNKSNNTIENLQIVYPKEHSQLHKTEERSLASKLHADKIRPLTKKWHSSKEGILWHKFHAQKNKFGQPVEYQSFCECCKKEYTARKLGQRFCSNKCKAQHRRDFKLDHVEKKCVACNSIYIDNKYARKKTCSFKCTKIYLQQLSH